MNGTLVEWKDRDDPTWRSHVIHYGNRCLRGGARCYETPKGSSVLSASTAHMRRLAGFRQRIYPYGVSARPRRLAETPLLETIRANQMRACYNPGRFLYPRIRDARREPPAHLVQSTPPSFSGNGARTLGQEALEQGVDVKVALMVPHGANTAAGDGQELREPTPTPGSSRWKRWPMAISEGTRARRPRPASAKAAGRTSSSVRDRHPSTLPRWRRRSSAASRATPVMTLGPRPLDITVIETGPAARGRSTSRTKVFVRRHRGGGSRPIRFDRQDHDRQRPGAGQSPRGCKRAFFSVINGDAPDRYGWLTYVNAGDDVEQVAGKPVGARI